MVDEMIGVQSRGIGCSCRLNFRGFLLFGHNQIEDYPAARAAVPPLAGFHAMNFNRSIIRSLTPQQAAGNALAIAGQTAGKGCRNPRLPDCDFTITKKA